MQPQALSGARLLFSINSKVLAAGHVLDYTIETAFREIECIDSLLPEELAPGRIKVHMSCKVFRTPSNDPELLKIAPGYDSHTSAADGAGEAQDGKNTSLRYISIEARDKLTDKTILFIPRAMLTRRSGSVAAEDLLIETWSIIGIGFQGPTNAGLLSSLGEFGRNFAAGQTGPPPFPGGGIDIGE